MEDKKFDALVKSIMAEAAEDGEPVTREEAEEMARMEMGAKEIRRYERSEEVVKSPKKRTVKKDEEKIEIINKIYNFLLTNGFNNATIVNEQREIKFNNVFSLTLTKHRVKKGE
jgi:hypothetical protein